jgi:DNA-directed RNA polymerase alpha subunit
MLEHAERFIERNAAICNAAKGGETYTSIAKRFGICHQRVRQICLRDERKQRVEQEHPLLVGLSTRSLHCLKNEGIQLPPDPAEVSARFSSECLMRVPNLGPKSILEISAWLESHGYKLRI